MSELCWMCKKNPSDDQVKVWLDKKTNHIIKFNRHFCSQTCEDNWFLKEFETANDCEDRTFRELVCDFNHTCTRKVSIFLKSNDKVWHGWLNENKISLSIKEFFCACDYHATIPMVALNFHQITDQEYADGRE